MRPDNIKADISACLVVYNEGKLIERCLRSIADFCKEIILIHDGQCTDNTLEIAKNYTNHIYIKEHVGEAEQHRVNALNYATGEWIFIIDADEFLTEEAKKIIRKELGSENPADGYSLIWPIWNGKRYLTSKWPAAPRIFRKEKMHYIAFPHSAVTVDGEMKTIPARLEHQPQYNNFSLDIFRKKHRKWIKIHAGYLCRDIYSLRSFNPPAIRQWPLHMRLIKEYGLFSIPVNFLIFLLSPFRYKEAFYNPRAVFRDWVMNCRYYLYLALEYRKIRKASEAACKK